MSKNKDSLVNGTVSIKAFWRMYALGAIRMDPIPGVPLNVNLSLFLNQYFGGLTLHVVKTLLTDRVEIHCVNCSLKDKERPDICESHLGLIGGITETIFRPVRLRRFINGQICVIREER